MKKWVVLIAAGLLLYGAYAWRQSGMVYANLPQNASEFFRTYNPGSIIRQFGKETQMSTGQSAGSGWRVATRDRSLTATIDIAPSRVAALALALRSDIERKLRATASQRSKQESSGEAIYEYETPNAWGVVILERIEPDSNICVNPSRWRVQLQIIERWHK